MGKRQIGQLDVSDLIENLRVKGYFALDAVDYALYESNGSLSVLPKQDYETEQNSLPLVLVAEGKFDEKNLLLSRSFYYLGLGIVIIYLDYIINKYDCQCH